MQRDLFGLVNLIAIFTTLQNAKANHRCIVKSVSGVALKNSVIKSYHNPSIHECFTDCKKNPDCRSVNFFIKSSLCEHNNITISDSPANKVDNDEATYIDNPTPKKKTTGWKLIARFSNSDTKNWMAVNGAWWYDITTTQGDTSNTAVNQDMIASGFWTTKGYEIKVTRTDDPTHTPLLVTTSNCLGGKTFREKISSFGNFRNGAIWSSNKCLGKCTVTYGGQYSTTAGFSKTSCDSNVLTRNQIGFWCDYSSGAGAVISIGGAGSACDRADHGLAVTEENAGKLGTSQGCDFGDNGISSCAKQSYALNLWILVGPVPPTTSDWKLIARFSNSDTKNWMAVNGAWWYDITTTQGDTSNTAVNQDMIASGFWTTKGYEIKVTRTDDPTHTPLLVTTSNCLGGKTFREKISSFGNFRNGAIWSSDKCLGKCTVTYGGQYSSTAGFSKTSCDSNVLTRNQIGFWCDSGSGAGAVISIGGAGSACDRADHGLAVTEENAGKFGTSAGCDFGDDGLSSCAKQSYALNLWIK